MGTESLSNTGYSHTATWLNKHDRCDLAGYFQWAYDHNLQAEALLVYRLLGLACSQNRSGNLTTLAAEFGSQESLAILNNWQDEPVVESLLHFVDTVNQDAAIKRQFPAVGHLGSVKRNRALFNETDQYLLLLLVNPLSHASTATQTNLRRKFRLWLVIQDAIRLVNYSYHGDLKLSPLIRSFVLGSDEDDKWSVIDRLLARTAIETHRFEDSFTGFTFALQAAAEFQRSTLPGDSSKYERDLLHRILAVATGEQHRPNTASESVIEFDASALSQLKGRTIGHWATQSLGEDEAIEIPLAELPTPDTDDQDDDESDPLLLVPVDHRASHARKVLSANSVYLQSAAAAHYLPWEWDNPLPGERKLLQQWVTETLHSDQPEDALGAATCWLASHSGRSLRQALAFTVQDKPAEEWSISTDGQRLHKHVTRRQNAWRPDAGQINQVAAFTDELDFELPPEVTAVLARAGLLGGNHRSLQDAWLALSDDLLIDVWFNRALPTPLQRLTAGKLMGLYSLSIFERSGDHYLARILSAHSRSGLPGACGYSAWNIKAIEQGTDLTPAGSLRDAPVDTWVLGSLLTAQEPLLAKTIEKANQTLAEAPVSLAHAHNRLAFYLVTALYAATGSRYLADPFERLDCLDLEQGYIFINDKSDDAGHDGRLVPLPSRVLGLVKDYLSHLQQLADALDNLRPQLTEAIRQLVSGCTAEMPLFFTLSDQLAWQSMNSKGVLGDTLFVWSLPNNLFRHRYAQQLQSLKVHPEVIDGWMGHSERHAQTWGDRSPRSWIDDASRYRDAIEQTFNALPFLAHLPSGAAPDYNALALACPSSSNEQWTDRLFGAAQRKRQRRIALHRAIKTARSEIDAAAKGRQLAELEPTVIQRLIGQMLSGKNQLGHHFAAIRLNILRKRLTKEGGEHQYLLKRYPVPALRERNALQPYVLPALTLLPHLQTWAYGVSNTSAKTGRNDAAMLGGLLLAIQKRISYERLLNDVMTGKNFRIVQHKRQNFLEYSEALDKDDLHAPVQRHEVSYQIASLLVRGQDGKSPPDPASSLYHPFLLELKILLGLSADCNTTEVVSSVTRVINQANLVTLPGMVAAVLSGRILSCSLPMQDQIRLEGKKPVAIPQEVLSDSHATFNNPEFAALNGRYMEGDSSTLKEQAQSFKQAIQACVYRYTPAQSRPIADEVQVITKNYEGRVSSAMLLVGHWLYSFIRRGKGRGKRHVPLAHSTVQTYCSSVIRPFQELAFDVDLLSLDEDDITDLYRNMLEFKRIRDNQIGYFGDRLYSFHQVARKAGVADPDWAELALGDELRRVRPGLITEADYLKSLELIKRLHPDDDQWLLLSFVLIACYRFGLRKNEACFLLRKDWCQNENQQWLLVRNNRFRKLKSNGSRRAVPLLFELRKPEVEVLGRMMARYDALAGQDENQPLLCTLTKNGIQPSPLIELISPALIQVIREASGNPTLVLHHARHAFHNRIASVLLDIGTPATEQLLSNMKSDEVRQCVLGDQHGLSRRSPMALARLMGHQQISTGMINYNHLLLSWADRLVPVTSARTREIPGALQTSAYNKYLPPHPKEPASLTFEAPTLLNIMKMLRLVSVGRTFTQAGSALGLHPDVVAATENVFFNANRKMFFNKRGEDVRIRGEDYPHALLHYIHHDAWSRLLEKAGSEAPQLPVPKATIPALDTLPSLIGRQRQLLMSSENHYSLVRCVLTIFDVDPDHYSVVAVNNNPKISGQLTEAQFSVKSVETASSTQGRLVLDPFDIIENGECIGTRSQYGVLAIQRNDQGCLRNSNELAVAFLSVALALQL